MAFVSCLRRFALPALLSSALATCSISDGLTPPASVDHSTRVSSIQSPRRAPVAMQPAESQQSYPISQEPVRDAQGSIDYLDSPNLAGTGRRLRAPDEQQPQAMTSSAPQAMTMVAPQAAAPKKLPMIDSDEALAQQNQTMDGAGSQEIPSGGVNMDEDLGAEPVVGLAQEEGQQIAEGDASEPVVDGIGTENVKQVNRRGIPQPTAEAQLGRRAPAATWGDGTQLMAPPSMPQGKPQEVAMLRPANPMSSPLMSEPVAPLDPGVMPASELSCRRELKRMGVIFSDKPAISNGPACQVPYPVSLKGLSGDIDVKPAVTLNCQVTLAFAKWVKNELAPSARFRYWSGIKTIEPLGGYSCRRMNNSNQKYNPMSEHAHGNAIDVGTFVLKNGHEIDVRKKGLFSMREGRLLTAVRSDSCKYFNTVLGPGSNPEHWNHFHFDLRSRKGGKVYCD